LIGWLFKRFDYSVPAAVIGILLGGMAEESLLFSYQISGGLWSYILERPVTIFILVMLVISLFGGKFVSMLTRKIKQ
jgi:putative tricarboxylic transport membrane protein